MSRFALLFAGSLSLVGAGCGLVDSLTPDEPEVPGDYPQLGSSGGARIDVVIDGTPLDAEGSCSYDDSGIDEEKLRLSINVDHLDVEVRDREIGEYSSRADEVVADWYETESFESSPACGELLVNIDGEKSFEGLLGQELASWGTLQLVLCNEAGDRMEVSGKFSCAPY